MIAGSEIGVGSAAADGIAAGAQQPAGPPEGPGAGFDRARDLPRVARLAGTLEGVEGAIRRLDAGTYGSCDVCGGALSSVVLDADPLRARCDTHLVAPAAPAG